MNDVLLVEFLQSEDQLIKVVHDLLFRHPLLFFKQVFYLCRQISVLRQAHHNAEILAGLVEVGFSVSDDVLGVDRGQDSNFIQGVFHFLRFQFLDVDDFESVDFLVHNSLYFEDATEGPFSDLLLDEEVLKSRAFGHYIKYIINN